MKKTVSHLLFGTLLLVTGISSPALAGGTDPLFVNLTSDDPHRASMAIAFGKNQLERGHPLTIFLNDKGVRVGSKEHAGQFANHQQALDEVMAEGAAVLICPMCMEHYGVDQADLIEGLQVGNPGLTGERLFEDGTRTLSW
jgi:sulfur relay (sulfurtransferase) complex TusBCD TusD component (DsrE family)